MIWGLAKIPFRFWYDRTPCASPLRALAPVRVSAYPIHRMQNCKDFCILQSKSCFLYKPQQKCEELCGLALRCHWRKRYYQTRFMRNLFGRKSFLKDLAVLGEPALAPFLLRMSCADLAPEALSVRLGFLTKHYIVDLLMKDLFQKGFNDIYII